MRIGAKYFLTGVAVIFLSLPAWAHTESTDLSIDHTVTISGKQLVPGDYQFKVQDKATQVSVLKYGKVVLEAPCHWIQLPEKATSTIVRSSENQLTEIDFKGETAAVQLP